MLANEIREDVVKREEPRGGTGGLESLCPVMGSKIGSSGVFFLYSSHGLYVEDEATL